MRFKKSVFLSFVSALTIVPITTLVSCNQGYLNPELENMRGQGSSSVLPIMNEIKTAIKDFQYEGTGSGDGVKAALNEIPKKDFGMTSSLKNPSSTQVDAWKSLKIRTITFAIDAIGIALNLPNAVTNLLKNEKPKVDGTILGKLYDKDKSNDNSVTWKTLLVNDAIKASTLSELNQNILALGRIGGKAASGTADGFFHKLKEVSGISELDTAHSNLSNDRLTAEANSAAYQALKGQNNGLTYLSLGYALLNETSNIKVGTIVTSKNEEWVPLMENVTNKNYKWTRPFNMLFQTTNEKAVKFASYLLSNQIQEGIKLLNFVELTIAQIDQQLVTHSIEDSDEVVFGTAADLTKSVLGLDV